MIYRFKTYENAQGWLRQMNYSSKILLGDDGRYWVADSWRKTAQLIKAGYEIA